MERLPHGSHPVAKVELTLATGVVVTFVPDKGGAAVTTNGEILPFNEAVAKVFDNGNRPQRSADKRTWTVIDIHITTPERPYEQ